jgi:hypothetical protein
MGERGGTYRILLGKPKEKRPMGHGGDKMKRGLQEVGWGAWTGLIWLMIGTGGGLF